MLYSQPVATSKDGGLKARAMATTLAQARLPLRATNNQPEDHSAYFEMAQPRAVLPSWKEPEQNVQGDLWSGLPPTKPVRDTVDGEESRLCELHIFSTAPVVLFTQVFIICR